MNATDETVDVCNSLLRGEISAVETYVQAIKNLDDASNNDFLEQIRFDHESNAAALRAIVLEANGVPSTSSGPWGGFAKVVEGAATLIGETPALMVLRQGEEHGINVYNDALANPNVSDTLKKLIHEELLPSLNDHLIDLKSLIDDANKT